MQDILATYLQQATTPELKEVLEQAHEMFDRMGLQNYEEGFEQILMLDDETDQGGTLQSIVDLTEQLQQQILQQHQVTLSDGASMETATIVANGILDIQDYSNTKEILDIANMDASNEEILAELLSLVTPKKAEELLPDIELVNRYLITRLAELVVAKTQPSASGVDQELQKKYIDSFRVFLHYVGDPTLNITKAIANGLDVGYPFLVYAGMLGRELEEMSVERAANELMGMALLSSDGHGNPRSTILANLDNYISNVDMITKIDIKLGEYLLGLQR